MKQERIEELLKGGKYDPHTYADVWGASAYFKGGEATWNDAYLNAARVQLLAKALQEAQQHLLKFIGCRCDEEDCGAGGCSACRHMDAIENIQNALKEAGMEG
jgi:hypothetical protein